MYDFIWSMNSVISSNDANHMNSSYTAIDEFIYYVTWIHLENYTHVNSDNKWIHLIDQKLYKEIK